MHINEFFGWDGPMTQFQFDVWNEWFLIEADTPTPADHYMMQVAQFAENLSHIFDTKWKTRDLLAYRIRFGVTGAAKAAPERKEGKIPMAPDDWWPHPLTKAEVDAGTKSYRLGRAGIK